MNIYGLNRHETILTDYFAVNLSCHSMGWEEQNYNYPIEKKQPLYGIVAAPGGSITGTPPANDDQTYVTIKHYVGL
ncbi:hypothetical protein ACFFW8_11935 [Erwinia tracheiphila]